jgi:hypothetical protein
LILKMDSKELRSFAEAYKAVHAPQEVDEAVYGGDPKKEAPKDDRMVVTNADKKANTKAYQNFKAGVKGYKAADHMGEEVVEEGLRSAVKRLLGGGKKEAEAPKPESRGEQLRKKYNVGPEKSDTSAKRQILDRSRAKAEKDEKDYGDKPFQKQVAQKSKAAHDRYLKAGYSKYGAGDARGRGSKAAKRAAALNKEEFEIIVNALIEEGYDLSSYTWDEMYEVCLDEAVKGASRHDTEMRKAASTERKSGIKNRLSPAAGKDNADKMQRDVKFFDKLTKKNRNVVGLVTKEEVEQLDELSVNKMHDYINKAEKDRDRLNKKWDQGTATSKERKKVFDREEGESRASEKIRQKTGKDSFRLNALDKLKSAITKESYDLFDAILEYLVAEGYADTNESALVIMANMSEEWRQSIVEGDNYDKNRKRAAQRAAERNAARDAGKTGNVPGVGYVTPRRERETYVDAAGTTRHKSGAKMP